MEEGDLISLFLGLGGSGAAGAVNGKLIQFIPQ